MVTRQPEAASDSTEPGRLLHLRGILPENAQGSPIIDEQGRLIAVYVEKADLSGDESLAGLAGRYHYAVVLGDLAELLEGKLDSWQQLPHGPAPDQDEDQR